MKNNCSTPLLSLSNIRKEYIIRKSIFTGRPLKKVVAVKGLSFDLQRGVTLGIVGESGSGKSTAGEIAGGLQDPTYGKVYFEGRAIKDMSKEERAYYRRNVQFIFQDPKGSMDPYYTIGDIVAEPLMTLKISANKQSARDKALQMLERVGLSGGISSKYPGEISGGQCQRVAIARALAVSPKVIICDEPVSALDLSVQAQILNLLKGLQKEFGISYIFISHDIGVVNYMADTIMVMNTGNIIEAGEARSILKNPTQEYTKKLIQSAFINNMSPVGDFV